jgi:transposase
MVSMYKWQQIRVRRERGEGIKTIARALGISKNTVRKYLRSADPPKFKERQYEKKVDRFREHIEEMLGKGYIGTRIFKEIVAMGYGGSLSGLHRYIHRHKEHQAVRDLSTTRVESPPGQQMQYDWKEWRLPVGGRGVKIYLHEVVLSYSRKKHYSFSLRITCQDVIRAIESAIVFFGAAALQLLIDNGKQMVWTHGRNGVVAYNEEFLKFCGLYAIEPRACHPYRARTKGKAERPFYYIQEHLLRGLEVESLEEFEAKLAAFTEAYNKRPHSTLGEPPQERFLREKELLLPVRPVEPTVLYDRDRRTVSNDGYIRYAGGYYPVPMRLCLQEVWVESISGTKLRVYDMTGKVVSEQPVHLFEDKKRPEHPEHEVMNQAYGERKRALRSALVERFSTLFGAIGERFILGLHRSQGANLCWHLSEILCCCDLYDPQDVREALGVCVEMGSFHKNSLLRALDHRKLKNPPLMSPLPLVGVPREGITRPLSVYAALGEVAHE